MRLTALVLIGILAAATSASADLCPDCRNASYTKDIGRCTHCASGQTMSGQFKLCLGCSQRLGQCEHCLKPLKAAATQPATQPATQAINPKADGTYKSGAWEYRYTVAQKDTRSEGYTGELLHDGKPVAEPAAINDFHQTPWGPLYWVGNPIVAFGGHGWMPKPKVSAPAGNSLPEPAADKH